MHGIKKVLNQPRRHSRNPIIVPDQPWEGTHTAAPTVLYVPEAQAFYMYYWAYGNGDHIFTCFARSTDGIRWEKPILGLHEGPDGTKDNNIVLRGEGKQARTRYVAIAPNAATPDERFVAMYVDNVPGLTEFVATSPDGIHWRTVAKIGDLRDVVDGPPTANPRFFLVEQKWDVGVLDHRYRAIWRTESNDFKTWGGGTWAVRLEPEDDPNLEFYHATSHFMGDHTYHGLHLGYYYPYHTDPGGEKKADGVRMAGTIDTSLMVSRDTIQWVRVDRMRPFFPLGKQGSWDAGMVFLHPELVVANQAWFYYSGHSKEHSATDNTSGIGLATLRLDGFVSVEPEGIEGTLTTKAFELTGSRLEVNVDARSGELRVAILNRAGDPVPGLEAGDCEPITKDGLRQDVTWAGGKTLGDFQGATVRLRFDLKGSVGLYAFQIVSVQWGETLSFGKERVSPHTPLQKETMTR